MATNTTLEAIPRLGPRVKRTSELAERVAASAVNSEAIGLRLNRWHLLGPAAYFGIGALVVAVAATGVFGPINLAGRVFCVGFAWCLSVAAAGLLRSAFERPRSVTVLVDTPGVVERAARLEELETTHGPDAAAAMLRILDAGWYRQMHAEAELSKAVACLTRLGGTRALTAAADVLTDGVSGKKAYDCDGVAFAARQRVLALRDAAELIAKRKGGVGEFVATAVEQRVPTGQLRMLATEVTARPGEAVEAKR